MRMKSILLLLVCFLLSSLNLPVRACPPPDCGSCCHWVSTGPDPEDGYCELNTGADCGDCAGCSPCYSCISCSCECDCTTGQCCDDGSCVNDCPSGECCDDGTCVSSCPTGKCCDEGTCVSSCPTGKCCDDGTCVNNCPSGECCDDGTCKPMEVDSVTSDKDSAPIQCEDITFTVTTNPSGYESNVSWSGGGDPSTGSGATFTTHWDTSGIKTVTASLCDSSESKQVTIFCPTGETTLFDSWDGPSAGFKSQLTPTSADFSCLTVRERDGTGSQDDCWFSGSIMPKYESLAGPGFTWGVGANNWWGNDWLGWGSADITYYRNNPPGNPRAPCCTHIAQIMDVVDGGCDYASHMLILWINTTTVVSSRNMVSAGKPYP